MPSYIRLAAFACAVLASSRVPATEPADQPELKHYDVEVIIFKNISVPKAHEFNLPTPSANREPSTLDLSDSSSVEQASAAGFSLIPVDELRLRESVQNIIRSSRYGLLLHTGWRQPGLDEASSIPVWIKGGQVFDSRYSSIDQVTDTFDLQSTEEAVEQQGTEDATVVNEVKAYTPDYLYELEGQITITLSRYLHTDAELVLRKPAEPGNLLILNEDPAAESTPQDLALEGQLLLNHALNEKRRMRSRKLHYLDHPEFGMLVLITPYQAPEKLEGELPVDPSVDTIPPQVDPDSSS